ncbi:AAA domain (dynein-related subfamily) [Actinomadura rubteroloni]|uniref:AAA domain (Dynein-related subfamily) n=1 Tax=Actinomadura rubteroloni TaxID=1926885 RepID=A0A2P4UJ03_9ACTN|nr:MoxR family ATPase [Actinomadura rubteroloni]POM25034.1 AAA domain (dynein-related subfamily) [Actinomadura rubteroloni]
MPDDKADWLLYTGRREPHDGIDRLPKAPRWRRFDGGPPLPPVAGGSGSEHRATTYLPSEDAVQQVNAALYLRRPLLVTGPPGTGKSTLAYAVAHELMLGPVLHWPITSRVTLRDGLYQYDPLTRLYAAGREPEQDDDIGRYVRLGPLGTALLPYARPRVLLIDEIDKSDIDLPNDLLTIFEKGEYEIPELARRADSTASVLSADGPRVTVDGAAVRCAAFPFVVMTSNGEREFPPAFLRRCITLELRQPTGADELSAIVREHLGDLADESEDLVRRFLDRSATGTLATDQLLNAVYLCRHADAPDRAALADRIMPYLGGAADDD